MNDLLQLKCVPCRGGIPPMTRDEVEVLLAQVSDWDVIDIQGILRLERIFRFRNFGEALKFTLHVGESAEKEDHHPAILTEWGKVTVTWWTHKIRGLHQNDFIMAAKTDEIFRNISPI